MPDIYAREMFSKGLEALERDQVFLALSCLEQAKPMRDNPLYCSSLALCLAKTRNAHDEAISLCSEAVGKECCNPTHYLHLGRILILAGEKSEAVKTFREGLKYGKDPRIIRELENLGIRRPPLFPSLDRRHPLNRFGGLLMSRLRCRD
jgi:tetratricopeptide (TPR) repeat protein